MVQTITFNLNNEAVQLKTDPQRTLLWVLRTHHHLYGRRYCQCGI